MKYLIFDSKEKALERSRQEAVRLGCDATTLYWWGIKQTQCGQFAFIVGDETEGAVSQEPEWVTQEPGNDA